MESQMCAMLTKKTIKIVLLVIICFVSYTFLFFPQTSLNTIDSDDIVDEGKFLYVIKPANNDTTPPVITFIQPDTDNITIKSRFYDVIVNIEDENPPLPGNVSLEFSNSTYSFFNGSMTLLDENEWFFTWDNITSYPNRQAYSFKVTAKDSNENIGISEVIVLYVDLSKSPVVLNVLFYFIAASVIIGGILIYVNKRRVHSSSSTDRDRVNY